jgi:ABC-type sugar transport system ATPase subunit
MRDRTLFVIELCDVQIQTGSFRLTDISFQIPAGQYAVLMGKTGQGKTTILECICGLRNVMKGTIRLGDNDVTKWLPGDRQTGYVPQDLALFPTHTVRSHLEFAQRLRRVPTREVHKRVDEMAAMLSIGHLLDRRVQGLSGGESQRVALGRALSFRPSILLLDEPLSALDESTRQEIQSLLRRVHESSQVTTLHVTHNQREADALADRTIVLEEGKIVG